MWGGGEKKSASPPLLHVTQALGTFFKVGGGGGLKYLRSGRAKQSKVGANWRGVQGQSPGGADEQPGAPLVVSRGQSPRKLREKSCHFSNICKSLVSNSE